MLFIASIMKDNNFNEKLAEAKVALSDFGDDIKHLENWIQAHARGENLSQEMILAHNDNKKDVLDILGDFAAVSAAYWGDFSYAQVHIAIDKLQATVSQIDILNALQTKFYQPSIIPADITLHQDFTDSVHQWVSNELPFLRNKGIPTQAVDVEVLADAIEIMIENQNVTEGNSFVMESKGDLLEALDEGKLKIIGLSLDQMKGRINMAAVILANIVAAEDKHLDALGQKYEHIGLDFVSETLHLVCAQIEETRMTIVEIDSRLPQMYMPSSRAVYALDMKY